MRPTQHATIAEPAVLIIGAGFGGLAMALELKRAGRENFTILERSGAVGGVWRENTYPGAGCDIPSPYYSFSFAPNPAWPDRFSCQADIREYMERVVDRYRLREHIRFDTEVTTARFDESSARWQVTTAGGEDIAADVLVPAAGQLSRPATPAIPGIETFRGHCFHSARWDHGHDLAGERVAVIGTGASAVQFVPRIQPEVATMTVFQRSAPWVLPKPDVHYKPWHHALFRAVPPTRLAERAAWWGLCEVLALGLVDLPPMRPVIAAVAGLHLRYQVTDERLRAVLTPDYEPGCKRVLFSGDYYPALAAPNAEVVTESINAIAPKGVQTADGRVHEVDTIIYGTGFHANDFLAPMTVEGRGGTRLDEVWRGGASAYLGMTVPGFPNLFLMYGPNTNLGVGSIIYMLECQARYIGQAIRSRALRPGVALEVRRDAAAHFDARLQRRLRRSVWTVCSSWYRNAAGRVTNNWPGTVSQYRARTRTLRLADYQKVLALPGTCGTTVATLRCERVR